MANDYPAVQPTAIVPTALLAVTLCLHLWCSTVGWENRNLPGLEFRQAQTAISAFFIQRDNDFSLAYPTPVLGKPWSIPMEFPLYQWTVVGLSNLTGEDLTQTARGVSLGCFYLTLPAIAVFLRRLGLSRNQIAIALTVVLSCPLYVFYGRAFLIETMALAFATWFAVGFIETIKSHSWSWAITASITGAVAGAVKVTTLIVFLLPCAGWGAWLLWGALRRRDAKEIRSVLVWGLGPVILPVSATVAWTHYADQVKSVHPQAAVLMSDAMSQFNFGYGHFSVRFDSATWKSIAHIIDHGVLSLATAGVLLVAGVIWGGRWRSAALLLLLVFVSAPIIFPLLYAWHDYYFVANALFLLLAAGLILAGIMERPQGVWIAPVLAGLLLVSQASTYRQNYYLQQSLKGANGPKLSFTLMELTHDDEVLVIVGDDWNSMVPYYARRRALMIRRAHENNFPLIRHAMRQLEGERIGALVLMREQRGNFDVVELAEQEIGISRHHYFIEEEAIIYPTQSVLEAILPPEVLASHTASPLDFAYFSTGHRYADRVVLTADLSDRERRIFKKFSHLPTQFYFQFGPGLTEYTDVWVLNAHSETKLWYDNIGDARTVFISGGMMEGSWQNQPHPTDGVSLEVSRWAPDGDTQPWFTHHLDPIKIEAHRGMQQWTIPLPESDYPGLLIRVGPGPSGSGSTDWFFINELTLQ